MILTAETQARLQRLAKHSQASLLDTLWDDLPRQGPETRIEWRIKSAESIAAKIERRRDAGRKTGYVNDLLGFRIIVSHVGLVETAARCVHRWIDRGGTFRIVDSQDYFRHPVSDIYRSYHFDTVLSDRRYSNISELAGVEFQITTYLQNFMALISHDLVYADHKPNPETMAAYMLLKRAVRDIGQVDDNVAEAYGAFPRR